MCESQCLLNGMVYSILTSAALPSSPAAASASAAGCTTRAASAAFDARSIGRARSVMKGKLALVWRRDALGSRGEAKQERSREQGRGRGERGRRHYGACLQWCGANISRQSLMWPAPSAEAGKHSGGGRSRGKGGGASRALGVRRRLRGRLRGGCAVVVSHVGRAVVIRAAVAGVVLAVGGE